MTPVQANRMGADNPPYIFIISTQMEQRDRLLGLLLAEGFSIETFPTAESATDALLRQSIPDLIITDLLLDGIDGWRFCRYLRASDNPALRTIPVLVFSSAFNKDEPSRIAIDLGAISFFPTPLDTNHFLSHVNALLTNTEAQQPQRILILESDPQLSAAIKDAYIQHGYRVDTAFNVNAAMECLSLHSYFMAVLADNLTTGGEDGASLLPEIISRHPQCTSIIITSDPTAAQALGWLQKGALAFLRKPIKLAELLTLSAQARREHAMLRMIDLLEERTREARKNAELYQAMLHFSSDLTTLTDPEGSIIYVSPQCPQVLGYPADTFIGQVFPDIIHPDDVARCQDRWQYVAHGGDLRDFEYRIFDPEGMVRCVSHSAKRLKIDGQILGILSIIRNVTGIRLAEAALQENEAKYRLIVENITDLLVKTDPAGNFLFASASYCQLFGQRMEDLLGKTYDPLVHPSDLAVVSQALEALFTPPYTCSYQERAKTIHGWRWIEWDAKAELNENGTVAALVGIGRDITARVETEIALRKEREQLLSIFDSIDPFIYVSDPDTFEIIFVNRSLETLLGKKATGNLCYREFQGLDSPCPFCTNAIIQEKKPLPHHWEFYNKNLDRYFSLIDRIITWTDGRAVRFEIASDISERKRAEEQLLEQLEELRRWQSITLGREMRILELKHEVNALLSQNGQPPRYPSAEEVEQF